MSVLFQDCTMDLIALPLIPSKTNQIQTNSKTNQKNEPANPPKTTNKTKNTRHINTDTPTDTISLLTVWQVLSPDEQCSVFLSRDWQVTECWHKWREETVVDPESVEEADLCSLYNNMIMDGKPRNTGWSRACVCVLMSCTILSAPEQLSETAVTMLVT